MEDQEYYGEQEEINEEELEAREQELIERLATEKLKTRDEAVAFRAASGVEDRWREAENLFDGVDSQNSTKTRMIDYATGEAAVKDDGSGRRSKVIVNLIRPKCETAIGRFSDIQLPVDGKNWGAKNTPVPEIAKAMKDERQAAIGDQPVVDAEGKPITVADVAKSDHEKAVERMSAMEQEINDQLTESEYNTECRKAIVAACKLGTGIIKGPNIIKRIKKAWVKDEETGAFRMDVSEDERPSSNEVSCWNVYPAPECDEDIKKAPYVWEKRMVLARELRGLIGIDGYLTKQIQKVLSEDPIRIKSEYDEKHGMQCAYKSIAEKSSKYERWDYYGDITRDDLEVLGVDVEKYQEKSYSACIVFVNDRPIKAQINVLDSGDMPYDLFSWTEVTGSPWGMGIPEQGKWPQRIATAGLRAMMDNAGDSSGANVVIGKGIKPADEKYEITGKKLWVADDEIEDVNKVFAQFQLANNQPALQAIIELAIKFLDIETAMPMLFQAEGIKQPETLGATNIMVDANNVSLRSRVKRFDDMITRPHIKRYYDWNMQYSEKENIKGDFEVDVIGATVLMEKDQHAQILMQLLAAKGDPDMNRLVNWEKAGKKLMDCFKLSDILKTDEELAAYDKEQQNKRQPADPRIEAAKLKIQGDMEKAQLVQESDMAEIQAKSDASTQDRQLRAEEAERERQHDREMKEMEMNMKMMELSNQQGISLDKIKAQLAGDSMKMRLQKYLSDRDGGSEQILEPPSEPPQQAAPGHAFED